MKLIGGIQRNNPGPMPKKEYEIKISENGKQVDFFDKSYRPNAIPETSNVTRLVLGAPYSENGKLIATDGQVFSGMPIQTNRGIQQLFHAKVSWYEDGEKYKIDKDGQKRSRETAYTDIILGVDVAKINEKDMAYCEALFVGLLEEARVRQYMFTGLLVDPKDPSDCYSKQEKCGNYIGNVIPTVNRGYQKYFDGGVGSRVHDSEEMIARREEYYTQLLDAINKQNEEDEQEIRALQRGIKDREPKIQKIQRTLKQCRESRNGIDI